MKVTAAYKAYSDEADTLSQNTPTPQTRERLKFLLSAMATMREFGHDLEQDLPVPVPVPVADEHRAAKHMAALHEYVVSGKPENLRNYAPMSTTVGTPLPEGFLAAYREALKSFSGIREAGATVITTANGDPLKNPFSDDTANTGARLAENTQAGLVNPTLSKTEFTAYNYTSQGVQYSVPLLRDAGIDVTAYLRNIFAKRIGRITNTEFTNGAGGGPTGVNPSITNAQTTASATAVTVAEIVGLQGLDEGYLSGSVYMFSPGVERTLKAMVNADGLPVFPEMRTGKVLAGYPYVLNVDMPSALTATAKAIVFGNLKLGVVIRDVVPTLLVSHERFAESRLMYAVFFNRQDCQLVDPNALTVLQQHS